MPWVTPPTLDGVNRKLLHQATALDQVHANRSTGTDTTDVNLPVGSPADHLMLDAGWQ